MTQEPPKDVVDQLIENTEAALKFAQQRLDRAEGEASKRKAQVVQLQKSLAILKGEEPPKKAKRASGEWTPERRAKMADLVRERNLSRNGAIQVAV